MFVNRKFWALAVLFLCASTAAYPQAAPDAPKGDADATSGSFTIQVENDVFNRLGPSDRDYTSGLRIGWMSGPTAIPSWLASATTFPAFFGEPQPTRIDRRWGVSLGQNIYPPEVEQLLERHPDIVQVCVVPVPDELKGEKPYAFVVTRLGSALTEDAVKTFALAQAPAYQHPRGVAFVTELPLAGTNKVDRKALRARAIELWGASQASAA